MFGDFETQSDCFLASVNNFGWNLESLQHIGLQRIIHTSFSESAPEKEEATLSDIYAASFISITLNGENWIMEIKKPTYWAVSKMLPKGKFLNCREHLRPRHNKIPWVRIRNASGYTISPTCSNQQQLNFRTLEQTVPFKIRLVSKKHSNKHIKWILHTLDSSLSQKLTFAYVTKQLRDTIFNLTFYEINWLLKNRLRSNEIVSLYLLPAWLAFPNMSELAIQFNSSWSDIRLFSLFNFHQISQYSNKRKSRSGAKNLIRKLSTRKRRFFWDRVTQKIALRGYHRIIWLDFVKFQNQCGNTEI